LLQGSFPDEPTESTLLFVRTTSFLTPAGATAERPVSRSVLVGKTFLLHWIDRSVRIPQLPGTYRYTVLGINSDGLAP